MRQHATMAIALVLFACTSVDLEDRAPAGFDLNGRWRLNAELSDPPPDPRLLLSGMPTDRRLRDMIRRDGPPGGALASVVHDFPVLVARELEIEQSADSMGVHHDQGNYRDVSWGYRERGIWEIWAGWEGGVLVIVSEANDAKARETVTLTEAGRRIVVDVAISTRIQDIASRRVYDRVD